MVVDFTILDVIDPRAGAYTDKLETNGAGTATFCGGCTAFQSRLVVDHEVGRDMGMPKTDAGKRLNPAAGTWLAGGEARGSCVRGEPQIADGSAVIAMRGRWRTSSQTVGNAQRGVSLVMLICSSSTKTRLALRGRVQATCAGPLEAGPHCSVLFGIAVIMGFRDVVSVQRVQYACW